MKKNAFLLFLLFSMCISVFGFEPVPTEKLLLSYLENDLDLKKLTLEAEKAALSQKGTKIDNGFGITLSSGSINIKTTENGISCTTSPGLTMSLPQAMNLSFSAKTSVKSAPGKDSPENETSVSDSSFSIGMDIISSKNDSTKISLLSSERMAAEALQRLEIAALDTEKAFYQELKSLLNSVNSIIQSQKRLHSDILELEKVKAQGFDKNSSTYKMAEIQVFSDRSSIKTSAKSLLNDFIMFYKKCGIEFDSEMFAGVELEDVDILKLIPSDIQVVELVDVASFNKDDFIEIENAAWRHELNSMKRKSNKNFSLSANTGYTIDNSFTNSDSFDFGLNSSIGGVGLRTGVSVPIGNENASTSFTISAEVNPNTFRKNSISKEQNALSEEQEMLDIQKAEISYNNFVFSSQQKKEELLLQKSTTKETYEMYEQVEKEMAEWFEKGVVSESQYLTAKNNADSNRVKLVINEIDMIIYNNDIQKKFIKINPEALQ